MQKLQELTDKIYQEGILKAEEQSKTMLESAEQKARIVLEEAREEARRIVSKAQEEADLLKKNIEAEVKMAGKQSVNALKQQMTSIIVAKAVDVPVGQSVSLPETIKSILVSLVGKWNPRESEPIDLAVMLPETIRQQFDKIAISQALTEVSKGVDVSFSSTLKSGFTIGPKDGSFVLTFTEEAFQEFFKSYLRPKVAQFLFGE